MDPSSDRKWRRKRRPNRRKDFQPVEAGARRSRTEDETRIASDRCKTPFRDRRRDIQQSVVTDPPSFPPHRTLPPQHRVSWYRLLPRRGHSRPREESSAAGLPPLDCRPAERRPSRADRVPRLRGGPDGETGLRSPATTSVHGGERRTPAWTARFSIARRGMVPKAT